MRTTVLVFASLGLLSAAVAARSHDPRTSAALAPATVLAQAAAPAVKAPDTPAGRALTEFVDSFNAGGKARETWLETRTTIEEGPRGNVLKLDAQVLQKYGPMTVVRIVSSSQELLAAVVRHGTSDRYGYLTIAAEPTEPFKVVNFGLRAASPEEIKGGGD
jgi:hypothetical protein